MNEKLLRYKSALEANGFTVKCFATKEEARDAFLSEVGPEESVGFGGSVTTREMGLVDALKSRGNTLYSHWEVPEGSSKPEQLLKAMTSDVYTCSANAVTASGEIINIDGTGNRLAALLYGHKRVYIMVGKNKLSGTAEEAMLRIKNQACPPNAARLNRNTPCAKLGYCTNCDSPDRICSATLTLNRKVGGQEIILFLIDETLGF